MICNSYAQQPYSIHYQKSGGLPSHSCYDILQDRQGILWIASDVGLSSYDGFEFKTHYSLNQTSLPGSNLLEDKYGRIWYQNFDGNIYYILNDTLRNFKHEKPLGYYPIGITDTILWFVGEKQIIAYSLRSLEELKRFDHNYYVESSGSNGTHFYITSKHGIYRYSLTNGRETIENTTTCSKYFKGIYFLKNRVFVANKSNESNGLFEIKENKVKELFKLNSTISFINGFFYENNQFWILTSKGVYRYLENGESIRENPMFKGKSISKVFRDFQNNYWLCSNAFGLYQVPNLNNYTIKDLPFLPNRIVQYKNDFIIATKDEEIFKVGQDFKTMTKILQGQNGAPINFLYLEDKTESLFAISNMVYKFNLGANNLHGIEKAAKKSIINLDHKYYAFAGSHGSGLKLKHASLFHSKSVWDMIAQSDFIQKQDSMHFVLSNDRAKAIEQIISEKAIYLGTNKGLFRFQNNTKREVTINGKTIYTESLLRYRDKILLQTAKGSVIEVSHGHARLYSPLSALNQMSLLKFYNNQLFFILNRRLCYIELDNKEPKIIPIELGLDANAINDYLVQNNKLIILTDQEIIQTDLEKYQSNLQQVRFFIQSTMVNGISQNIRDKKLGYKENKIDIKYSIISFGTAVPSIQYRINNEEWKLLSDKTRTLSLPSLAPGKYTIQLMLINNASQVLDLSFEIDSPLVEKGWFWALILLPFIFIAAYYSRREFKFLNKENILLKERVELEENLSQSILTSIKSQMNPHFLFNALNTIQAYIYNNDKHNASKYLSTFSKLTRRILEHSEKSSIILSKEIETLKLYLELEKMRFLDNFHYNIEVDPQITADYTQIPSMIVQPYVENAVKHGLLHATGDKKLKIEFKQIGSNLKIIVEDNGIGRKKSWEMRKKTDHTSFAVSANEKRLKIINKENPSIVGVVFDDLYDENNLPAGTRVTININIKNE